MDNSKTLFCSSKFSLARGRISSKCIDSLNTDSQKGSPALWYYIYVCVCVYVCVC
jgi:hypothetical protein